MLGRRQARTVWSVVAAVLGVAVAAAIVGAAAVPALAPQPMVATVFLLVAGVVVPLDLGIGWFVTSQIRKRASPAAPRDAVASSQVIVGSASALAAGLICCVFFFVSRQPLLLLLVVPCAASLLHWFPSEGRWASLAWRPAPGERPRHPMVRE